MKAAIIFDDGRIFVQFTPEKFAELLKKYITKKVDVDEAMAKIVAELKKLTISK